MSNQILTKQSAETELKAYFASVRQVAKSGEQFPINLDDVWQLVYERKGDAVSALKKDFIEGIDYVQNLALANSEARWGGNNKVDYHLSVPCLEFFIARKVRSVFDVYRQVFHAVADAAENATPEELKRLNDMLNGKTEPKQKIVSQQQVSASMTAIKWAKKLLKLNDTSVADMINRVTNEYQLPVSIDYVESKGTVHSLSELLKAHNIDMSTNAFNKLLEAKGIIKKIFRKSRNGEKSFWSLIDTKYGENFVNPKNPSETQPKYYDDMFNELIQIAL